MRENLEKYRRDLKELAKATQGLVGAQIAFICRAAAMMAIAESIQAPEQRPAAQFSISARHFQDATKTAREKGGIPEC